MAITDQRYNDWLADLDVQRVLIAEMDYAGGTVYVSTAPFISRPDDSDPNRVYVDVMQSAVDISQRTDGRVSFGEIELVNDGELDDWQAWAWRGHDIRLYLGDPSWARDDYRLFATGINGGISEARRGVLVFEMDERSTVLDTDIDTGDLPNDQGVVPLALGSVFNAPAYLLQPSPYEFKASFLPCTALTPKDNGNPVAHTDNLSNGSFELSAALVGTLTVDIEEQHNTPALVVQWVASQYGLTVGATSLPSYTVGLYYNDAVTGRQILDDLCEGIGAYWYIDAVGELIVEQLTVATGTPDIMLFEDDIVQDSITLVETQQPWRALALQFQRNHNPLTTVAGTILENDPALAQRLQDEWRESKASQTLTDYPLAERVDRSSVLQLSADAATERGRMLAMRSVRRDVWSVEAFLPLANVGQSITVESGTLATRVARVISVSRSPTEGATAIEVWL